MTNSSTNIICPNCGMMRKSFKSFKSHSYCSYCGYDPLSGEIKDIASLSTINEIFNTKNNKKSEENIKMTEENIQSSPVDEGEDLNLYHELKQILKKHSGVFWSPLLGPVQVGLSVESEEIVIWLCKINYNITMYW